MRDMVATSTSSVWAKWWQLNVYPERLVNFTLGKIYIVSCFSFCMLWKFICVIMVFSVWYGTMNIFSSFVSMVIVDNDWWTHSKHVLINVTSQAHRFSSSFFNPYYIYIYILEGQSQQKVFIHHWHIILQYHAENCFTFWK